MDPKGSIHLRDEKLSKRLLETYYVSETRRIAQEGSQRLSAFEGQKT